MKKTMNPLHIPNLSPWPIVIPMTLTSSILIMLTIISKNMISIFMLMSTICMIYINSSFWWRDITRETTFAGSHTMISMKMLKLSMIIFIMSEIMFFAGFFWSLFHSSLSPSMEIGSIWPPKGMQMFNPMGIPLLNSIILLTSGATITWSHHSFLNKKVKMAIKSLMLTISLGVVFTMFQIMEYFNSMFSFSDSVYGSVFFMTTGFHGIHVMMGTMFLMNSLKSMLNMKNSPNHFIMFDLSAWYWHFVDVVWLFLFSMLYWWASI